MAKLTGRQIWLSILVVLLFSPVVLASGSAAFRPAWYPDRLAGVPLSVWLVVVLILVFVGLVALFARAAFGEPTSQDKARE
jgi:hypothetical protein